MKPQIVALMAASIALAACATTLPPQPSIESTKKITERVMLSAIQRIPGGYASERIEDLILEVIVEHTFYDSMASYIFSFKPCHRLRVKIQNVESYYTACDLGDGHYAIVKGKYSFNAIEKIRSGQIPSAFQPGK